MPITVRDSIIAGNPSGPGEGVRVRLLPRTVDAVSTVTINPEHGLSVQIDYAAVGDGWDWRRRIAQLFCPSASPSSFTISALTLAFDELGRLSGLTDTQPQHDWCDSVLPDTPDRVAAAYLYTGGVTDPLTCSGATVEVVRDRAAAQLAIRIAPASRWHALADNLEVGDDGAGRLCELRLYGVVDDC